MNVFFIFGGGGTGGLLRRTYGCQNFRGVRPHHRANSITRDNITPSFSYMGHNVKKSSLLALRRALGGPSIIRQYQSTYKIWKQYVQDFLSCRVNDEVSVDVAADAA